MRVVEPVDELFERGDDREAVVLFDPAVHLMNLFKIGCGGWPEFDAHGYDAKQVPLQTFHNFH
jgi:hypothetical protein